MNDENTKAEGNSRPIIARSALTAFDAAILALPCRTGREWSITGNVAPSSDWSAASTEGGFSAFLERLDSVSGNDLDLRLSVAIGSDLSDIF